MSSDRPKPRKVPCQPAWRVKRAESVPVKKYSRSELLSFYRPSEAPTFLVLEETFAEVFLAEANRPMFTSEQHFEHHLGEDVSARERPTTKMPDWYSEDGEKKSSIVSEDRPKPEAISDLQKRPSGEVKLPEAVPKPPEVHKLAEAAPKPIKIVIDKNAVIRNLPKDLEAFSLQLEVKATPQTRTQYGEDFFTEEFSQFDREMEKRLRQDDDREEELPEWANVQLSASTSAWSPGQPPAQLPAQSSVQTSVSRASQHLRVQSTPVTQSPASSMPSQSPTLPPSSTPGQPLANPASQSSPAKALPQVPIPLFDTRAPKFHISLLQEQIKTNNPFAKVIFQNGIPDSEGFMCCIPLSLPLERAWFYKDQKGLVRGPFSSIEMYNWNLVGYFPPNLQVSWRTPSTFQPLCELQRVASDFWGGDQEMVTTFTSTLPLPSEPPKPKQTLEINPNQAIRSMLGMETHRKTSSGWVAKTDKDANRRR